MNSTRLSAAACSIAAIFILTSATPAQIPFNFKFKQDSPLLYRSTHETKVEVKQKDQTTATVSVVKQLKKWDVQKVDGLGVATLELSIQELSLEQTEPDGQTIRFDSTDLENSNPKLAEQLKAIVGRPIIQVDIDKTGAIKAFKHLTQRQDMMRELPFHVTVPGDKIPVVGVAWRRDFPIQLEPPVATPPKTLRGVQACKVVESDSSRLVIEIESTLIDEVKDPGQMLPVVQFLPKGTVTFDPKAGRMTAAETTIDQTVANFAGEGSSYKFLSTYTEELAADVQQADRRE
jgi:hypothetical protein